MTNPANSDVQNLLPVQAYFSVDGTFQTFIGQGKPFYAIPNPDQSGLHITNSTIDSSVIGGTTPAAGTFTSIATTTGTISSAPSAPNDIVNKYYVDLLATGLSWKQPVVCATTPSGGNITLSGLQTIDTVTVTAGQRVLVKNQTNTPDNGIYLAASGAWTRALDANSWDELVGAIVFVTEGGQKSTAWYSTTQTGGTLGVTPIVWANFTISAIYTAGTGLQLIGTEFSIKNTGATAATYGSASRGIVQTVNAQGQITNIFDQDIAIAGTQITSGTIDSARLSGSYTGITGLGTLLNLTVTNTIVGNAATATTSTNIAGGAAGSVPYQSSAGATTLLAAGTNGQVLTLASGVPSWATPTVGTVTSVSGTGTVNGLTLTGTVTSSGSLTLGGTLSNIANSALTNSSITFGSTAAALGSTVSAFNGVSIGATTASTGAFTYLSTSSSTSTTPVLGFNASNCNLALGSTISSNFLQMVMQNKSGTAGASTNYVLSNDLGTDSTYYAEFGMNSSVFSASTPADYFSINNGIYFSGHDGDISIGSGNGFKTYFAWGTTGQSAHVINASGAIGLSTNLGATPSTSGTSGFGTAGYLMQSNGSAAAPTWVAQSTIAADTATTATNATNIAITDDTTTVTDLYPTFVGATTGNNGTKTSSTKLKYNPSTGNLTATTFTGAWAYLPAGTALVFQQTAAPTGWTKVTTNDNAALRVVSGTAGTGGTVAFTTAFASQAVAGTVNNTTLVTSQIPSHLHPYSGTTSTDGGYNSSYGTASLSAGGPDQHAPPGTGGPFVVARIDGYYHTHTYSGNTGNAGSDGAHNHSFSGTAINLAVKYVDVIVATKN